MVSKSFNTNGEIVRGADAAFVPFRALGALLLLSLTRGCRVR
ncbi:hypothetical protein GGQ66_003284 [Rhizobium borbori]|uniref:Uncharacterized protein n=1 Tax=Allorhizobium borbori TaxID=485907 RepID=A0A7W6K5V7_9HYPH|nr:hypothetical protein [Allorhizobium borbori]